MRSFAQPLSKAFELRRVGVPCLACDGRFRSAVSSDGVGQIVGRQIDAALQPVAIIKKRGPYSFFGVALYGLGFDIARPSA